MAFIWTEARVERVKQLYIFAGKSAAEIADLIGEGLTRNAVIGKAHRMGWTKSYRKKPDALSKRRVPTVPRQTYAKPPKPGAQLKPAAVFGKVDASSPAEALERRAKSADAGKGIVRRFDEVANDAAVLLTERRFGQCSWPVGEPDRACDQLCCGRPVLGEPNKAVPTYCAEHGKRGLAAGAVNRPKSATDYVRSLRRWAA